MDEPRPNSPEDVGFIPPAERPLHSPKFCASCRAPIFWAQILDEHGQRIFYEDARGRRRVKSMPVDAEPSPRGNVILFHREGEGIVCRTLRRGEAVRFGERLRTSHFATCPNAKQHRRSR
jgi:hypothetical protein